MNEDIIDRIKSRLAGNDKPPRYPPTSEEILAKAEANLGFAIPPLLRQIYAHAANGGFGPGYGIIGVEEGHASDLGTLVETYAEIKRGADYLDLKWKEGVLAFCGWGCNIFSCVDCNDTRYPIIQSDECRTNVQSYNLEDFFTMWLEGVDILGTSNSPRRTAEIINPFTRKKMRVTGRGGTGSPDAGPKGE